MPVSDGTQIESLRRQLPVAGRFHSHAGYTSDLPEECCDG